MTKKRKRRSLAKDFGGLAAAGVGLGLGAAVVGKMGSAGAPAAAGLGTAAGFLPIAGGVIVATHVVGMGKDLYDDTLSESKPRRRKTKRRRR